MNSNSIELTQAEIEANRKYQKKYAANFRKNNPERHCLQQVATWVRKAERLAINEADIMKVVKRAIEEVRNGELA